MKTKRATGFFCRRTLALAMLGLTTIAQAQVPGRVTTQEDRIMQGDIRWKAVAKKYTISTVGSGGQMIELELAPSQVKRIVTAAAHRAGISGDVSPTG